MDVIGLLPRLCFIRFPVGQAYLWHDPDGLTLIDAGLPGSAPLIADAICQSGYQPADLRRLVLTHFHADHIGAAAAITDRGEVEVLAHHADAPFIRAGAAGPAPDLAGWNGPSTTRSRRTTHPRRCRRPADRRPAHALRRRPACRRPPRLTPALDMTQLLPLVA
jgi:glyoxylase-like metal-dependent hydrolase (beta-lactamase superfamily II)